jgi:hypothetical protein
MAKKMDDFERQRKSEFGRLSVTVTNHIYNAIDELGIDKAELARRMKVSRPYVTQVLDGDKNMTLSTIVGLGLAVGIKWGLNPIEGMTASCFGTPYSTPKTDVPKPGDEKPTSGTAPVSALSA